MSDEAAISWPYSRVEDLMTKDPETLREVEVDGRESAKLYQEISRRAGGR